jgi:hypothetical protein
MKIARHWKRAVMRVQLPNGKPIDVTAWGWSADSADEALRRAEESVQRSAARVAAGQGFPDSYSYLDRPRREEIVEEIKNSDGEIIAMVTRNHYGSLVLNTTNLMFIDVDVPSEGLSLIQSIKRLFGIAVPDASEKIREQIAATAASRPEYTFRLYKTAAGFRLAVINKRITPTSPESDGLLAAFGSDPLYVKLCKNQESFRARLSPKHWRCGVNSPHDRFPFENQSAEDRHRNWTKKYHEASGQFATCTFVEQYGSQHGVADFRQLIDLHDRETKAASGLPLR